MSDNRYTYFHYRDLTPGELFFFIALEETRKELGLTDLVAASAILLGQNDVPVSGKLAEATKGTSVASMASRALLRHKLPRPVPTIIKSGPRLMKVAFTRNLGAAVGRAIPVVGYVILVADAYIIMVNTVRSYNRIVQPADRVF
ncbi:hypothetical protein FAZ95_21060 [Trinickia violacea]|uniref:Uncharacterized protein n=1 Tax=Trinickia violacea TaxID=2571746 RepID=A0A4P8IUB7_9BURK|nr:hypothetical protein [Trinickia violacea]QCP51425.1 hypothetical protein FAZ95_21060 [Trinickia violacea]